MNYPYVSNPPSNSPSSTPPRSPSYVLLPELKWSLIGHGVLCLWVLLKSLLFPSKVVPYVPTLKVDLVALPDILKKDLKNPSHKEFNKEISKLLKQSPTHAQTKPSPRSAPLAPLTKDEMALHPLSHTQKSIEKKNLRALERIKALSKIQALTEEDHPPHKILPVKGNKLSPGSSLSGEAKEALAASYYDTLRDHLQDNWTLPPWVARQVLAAQVQIFINSHGKLQSFHFKKSSGNSQFDDAVKRAIEESEPFPPPPKEIVGLLISDGILIGFPL